MMNVDLVERLAREHQQRLIAEAEHRRLINRSGHRSAASIALGELLIRIGTRLAPSRSRPLPAPTSIGDAAVRRGHDAPPATATPDAALHQSSGGERATPHPPRAA